MNCRKLLGIALCGFFFTFTASSCKTSNQNSNQQTNNPPPAKVGKWVAQWTAPAARDLPGTLLPLYSYTCVFAVSANVVFAAGDIPAGDKRVGIFVRTHDGGQNWTESRIERPDMNISKINALHFINDSTGWLAGATPKDEGVVLKTTDSGTTWEVTKVNFKQIPTAVFFVDENNGWMAGVPIVDEDDDSDEAEIGPTDLLVTSDGGKTWQPQRRLPVGLTDIHFIDPSTGWVVGQRGSIYKTTDGGRTWNSQKSELEPGEGTAIDLVGEGSKKFNISGVSFSDADNGYAAAVNLDRDQGRVLGTNNSGTAWAKRLMSTEEGYRDVYCLNADEAWMAPSYNKYIYYTANGGRYWNSEPVIADQAITFFRIHGVDAKHVWAAGGGGIFHRVVE
jgi:photosystem II stability/assembly factor-like uncharacterized protein